MDYLKDTTRLLYLAIAGISRAAKSEELVRALIDYDVTRHQLSEPTEEHLQQVERAREEAELAQREMDTGFPLLHGHALLGLWGAFEAMVEDFIVAWLCNVPESLQREEVSNIKIDLALFEAMTLEERMRTVARHVQRGEVGVGRFETGLASIGLGGSVRETTRRALVEAEAIRNVWAHRAGIADERFLRRCPWYAATVGSRIDVSHEQFGRLSNECVEYVLTILKRCAQSFGVDFDSRSRANR